MLWPKKTFQETSKTYKLLESEVNYESKLSMFNSFLPIKKQVENVQTEAMLSNLILGIGEILGIQAYSIIKDLYAVVLCL